MAKIVCFWPMYRSPVRFWGGSVVVGLAVMMMTAVVDGVDVLRE